jgi:hypothetical protein
MGAFKRANSAAAKERVGIDLPSGPALLQRALTNIIWVASVFFYKHSERQIPVLCVGAHKCENATISYGKHCPIKPGTIEPDQLADEGNTYADPATPTFH